MSRIPYASMIPRSVESLALLAMREAGADGYAVHSLDPRALNFSYGVPVDAAGASVAAFPLDATAIISFVFLNKPIAAETRAQLERIAIQIEAVWRLAEIPQSCATLAARVGELEAELADSKITSRVRGLLDNHADTKFEPSLIEQHVENVLRANQLKRVLEELARDLEEKIAERSLIAEAKSVLHSLHGMSEQEAHYQLQAISRKSRKPIKQVAREFVEARRTAASSQANR